jgi:hypothetical protein
MKPLSERAAELIIAMKGSRDIDPAKLPDLLVQIGDALRKVDAMDGEPARAPSAKSKVAPKSKTPSARKKTAAAPKQKVAAAASQAVGRGGTKRSGQAAPAQPKQAKKSSKKREEDMIPGLPPRKRGRPSKAEIAERERIIKAYKAAQRAERARKKAAAERLVSPSIHEPDIKPYKGARAPGDPAVAESYARLRSRAAGRTGSRKAAG